MTKLFVFFIFTIASFTAQSAEFNCAKLDTSLQSQGIALEASVIGKGRVYFHSAPDSQCKNSRIFVVPGDYLTVYNKYKNWLYVMFITKDGVDNKGWVSENRIQIHGKYGR